MKTQSHAEFMAELKAQRVPRHHLAFTCPMCNTIQSEQSLLNAGVPAEKTDGLLGFSCVGRFTNAGPPERGRDDQKGCNWTLGGLFQLHKLEVITEDGKAHPHFEVATPEQAQGLMQAHNQAAEMANNNVI